MTFLKNQQNHPKVAPGPPRLTAIATPAMFPNPTVAAVAVHNACLWDTSPGASFSFFLKLKNLMLYQIL